jgi:hypothetical protein
MLEQRREQLAGERDRLTDEVAKLDAALEAIRSLAGSSPKQRAGTRVDVRAPSEPAEDPDSMPPACPPAAKRADRRIRVIEFLLENSGQWFTAEEVASGTERRNPNAAQRNAVSETLRGLLTDGNVERDDTEKPPRYRAIPSALGAHLVREQ